MRLIAALVFAPLFNELHTRRISRPLNAIPREAIQHLLRYLRGLRELDIVGVFCVKVFRDCTLVRRAAGLAACWIVNRVRETSIYVRAKANNVLGL